MEEHVRAIAMYTRRPLIREPRVLVYRSTRSYQKYPDMDPILTERELTEELGYARIWDSGQALLYT